MDAHTGEQERPLEDEYRNAQPAWAADNERLVFASNRAGPRNLWEIDVRSRRLRQVTTGPGPDVNPVVSATGRLAYAPYRHQIDLYWGRVDRPQKEHQRLSSTTSDNFGGRFSPDGRQILYYSNRTGNYELWLGRPRDRQRTPAHRAPGKRHHGGLVPRRARNRLCLQPRRDSPNVRNLGGRGRATPHGRKGDSDSRGASLQQLRGGRRTAKRSDSSRPAKRKRCCG